MKSEKYFEELNLEIRNCKKCRLWESRKHAIPGEGNIRSKLVMVAQAPGYAEDEEGRMFVGPSGKKLDELMREADIERKSVFLTNIIRCMLPKYRKPKADEIGACTPYLDREIDMIKPKIIATLGYYPARYIFEKYGIGNELKFPEVCGKTFSAGGITIVPLRHPATLLFHDDAKDMMITNYRKLKSLLDSL